ncbi:uncharacterized protein LOC131946810 [Physella acuta]|uniref:uncharacterized protein LOC131946810 n=1 Tax=Physella acuta TaxID=109671 RepID=UPI0027DC3127|nr:uncharacterized protein LOC131946810 [Physella acuta]
MELVKVVLTLLACWSVAAQYPYSRIVEPSVLTEGGDYTVSCNSDLAGVPGKGQNLGLLSMSIGWTNEIDEMETFVRYMAITKEKYYRTENNIYETNMRFWTYQMRGPDRVNSHGWPDRDAINMTLSSKNAKWQESGIFCCNTSYLDMNDDIRHASRCKKIRVTHNIIVNKPEAKVEGAFTVTCDSNLAGVPAQTYGLYYLAILFMYQGEERLYARLGLGSYPLKVRRPPSPLRNWTFNFYGVETLDAHGRLERDKAKTELVIRDTKYSDSGMYCCEAAYFTLYTDDEQDVKRCQNITVTHREIVEPKAVSVGEPFSVFCDADLADVPDLIYGVRQFVLMWSSGTENPEARAFMNSRLLKSVLIYSAI